MLAKRLREEVWEARCAEGAAPGDDIVVTARALPPLLGKLTAAGVSDEAAAASVLLHRIATFYLPPVWGFFTMKWLQPNSYL